MKITRRKLATALVTTSALRAQPAANDDLKTKQDRMRADAAAVAAYKIPMATEPAFEFKA
jgi:hypothetical protein